MYPHWMPLRPTVFMVLATDLLTKPALHDKKNPVFFFPGENFRIFGSFILL